MVNPQSRLWLHGPGTYTQVKIRFTIKHLYHSWARKDFALVSFHIKPTHRLRLTIANSCALIEAVKLRCSPQSCLVYFYFDFSNTLKRTLEGAASSIIFQMVKLHPDIPQALKTLYFEQCRAGMDQPGSRSLCQVVSAICATWDNELYIVIDALDECLLSERKELLNFIGTLAHCMQVRLFLTSRREPDIVAAMKAIAADTMDLTQELVGPDVATFVHNRLERDIGLQKWGSNGSDMIQRQLLTRANGGKVASSCTRITAADHCKL
jgi:hypothetical protein